VNFEHRFRRPASDLPDPGRRALLRGAGALGALSLLGGCRLPGGTPGWTLPGLSLPLLRAPYQNNGATPWYANLALGTPGQPLKFALDTGSNFIWVTSTLCQLPGNSCPHYGGRQFDFNASSSFGWVDPHDRTVDFGPWGSMTVWTGSDVFQLPDGPSPTTTLYLSKEYSGPQFEQLDWDGGIGFPSGSAYVQPGISFFMAELMDAGAISPDYPYLAFDTDYNTRLGSCQIGGFDPDRIDPYAYLFLPWQVYNALPGVEYIWSGALQRYAVGGQSLAQNVSFALDSGSSQFKGDDAIMNNTLAIIGKAAQKPDVELFLGRTDEGGSGRIVVPPSVYEVTIEAGPQAGQTLPQFNPLGLTDLVLVGSVLMDQLYSVYEYRVQATPVGYQLAPVGIWLFNKLGGPQLIRGRSREPAAIVKRMAAR
jgi:saccharopepsin